MNLSHAGTMTKVLDTQLKEEELISREDPGRARRGKGTNCTLSVVFIGSKEQEMLFSFKDKYHYSYPNTYIALYSRSPKLPVTHTKTRNCCPTS